MDVNKRLKVARIDAGFSSASAAARHFGWEVPTYSAHENGTRGAKAMLAEYAKAFGVYYEWLKTGRGPQRVNGADPATKQAAQKERFLNPQPVEYIPVLGFVEAGAFREMTEEYDGETAPFIPFTPDKKFAAYPHFAHIARGDSMNAGTPPINEGAIVISIDWFAAGFELRNGMYVVVEQTREGGHLREFTVKEVEVVADGVNLVPRSTNPKHKKIFVPRGDFDDGTEVRIIGRVMKIQNDAP